MLCQDCGLNETNGQSWFCEECKYKRQLAATKRWRDRNPDAVADENRDWRDRHPSYDKDYKASRRGPSQPRGKTSLFASVSDYQHHYYETVTKPKRHKKEKEMQAQRLLAFLQTFDYNTEVEYFPNNGESYTTTTGEWLDANDGNGDELAEFVVRQGNSIFFATPEGEPLSPTDPVFTILDERLTQ